MKNYQLIFLLLLKSILISGQSADSVEFEAINQSSDWNLSFEDDCTEDWQSNWFLDGLRATVKNTNMGMVFSAGPEEGDHACHAVLWTTASFSGDIKIEYDYTRMDTRTEWVNILYIQATGIPPNAKDISTWNHLRIIPYMRTYFRNMEALHISYAAYERDNLDMQNDYIRARKYPVLPGQKFSTTTEVAPSFFKTGLFTPGETYKITVIKTNQKLYFNVEGESGEKLYSWALSANQMVKEGRIGLRHMYTRSALYKDFKVYSRK